MKFLVVFGFLIFLASTSATSFIPNKVDGILQQSMNDFDIKLNDDETFLKFLSDFDIKLDPTDDFQARKQIFLENSLEIDEHNQRYAEGKEHFEMGINQFTHLSIEEFSKIADCAKDTPEMSEEVYSTEHLNFNFSALPVELDYRSTDKVSAVKDQKQCGSCYVFASLATIESQMMIKLGKYESLSEQEAMECTNGCKGGNAKQVYDYTKKYSGCTSTEDYPYKAKSLQSCNKSKNPRVKNTIVKKYKTIKGEETMMKTLVEKGPLYVGFRVYPSFQKIPKGFKDVYRSKPGEKDVGGHAVTIVGYGTSSKKEKYWIIKNSYGTSWADKGFFKMIRGINDCKIESLSVYSPEI